MTLLYSRHRHDDVFPREHCARRLRPRSSTVLQCEGEDALATAGGTPALRSSFARRTAEGGCPHILELGLFCGFAFQGALEGLVESGLGFFVFLLGDEALLVLDFEVEEFVF